MPTTLPFWNCTSRALEATGAYFPGKWNDDLSDIQNHYLNNGGEFLVGTLDNKIVVYGRLQDGNPTLWPKLKECGCCRNISEKDSGKLF